MTTRSVFLQKDSQVLYEDFNYEMPMRWGLRVTCLVRDVEGCIAGIVVNGRWESRSGLRPYDCCNHVANACFTLRQLSHTGEFLEKFACDPVFSSQVAALHWLPHKAEIKALKFVAERFSDGIRAC